MSQMHISIHLVKVLVYLKRVPMVILFTKYKYKYIYIILYIKMYHNSLLVIMMIPFLNQVPLPVPVNDEENLNLNQESSLVMTNLNLQLVHITNLQAGKCSSYCCYYN